MGLYRVVSRGVRYALFVCPHICPQFAFFIVLFRIRSAAWADALSASYRAGSIGRNNRKYIYTCHGRTYRYGATTVNILTEVISIARVEQAYFRVRWFGRIGEPFPKVGERLARSARRWPKMDSHSSELLNLSISNREILMNSVAHK